MKKLFFLICMLIITSAVYSQTAKKFNKMGMAKFEAKDYAGAIEDYNRALAVDSNYAPAYFNRSKAKYKLGDNQGYLADMSKICEKLSSTKKRYKSGEMVRDKEQDSVYKSIGHDSKKSSRMLAANLAYRSGNAKYDEQDYTGAIADFDLVIKVDPKYAKAYNTRGNAKYSLLDFKGAIADYDQALKIIRKNDRRKKREDKQKRGPDDFKTTMSKVYINMEMKMDPADIYFNRAMSKSEIQDIAGAIADFDMAIELDPIYSIAYCYRGLVRIKAGQKDKGCSDLREARRLGYKEASEEILKFCK